LKVKICGIRTLDDALICQKADALGFIVGALHKTEDEITPDRAAAIISKLSPFINTVAVTHLEDAESIIRILKIIRPSTVQLHSEITLEEIRKVTQAFPYIKTIKVVHGNVDGAVRKAMEFSSMDEVDAILVDTKSDDRVGGTGKTHDWSVSGVIVKMAKKPVILAGGLNPDNVALAGAYVKPYAVDVNSGVEYKDGHKSYKKVSDFICAVRQL